MAIFYKKHQEWISIMNILLGGLGQEKAALSQRAANVVMNLMDVISVVTV